MSRKEYLYSIEAEQAVLGGLMLNNDYWDEVALQIKSTDFYSGHHQRIFHEMDELVSKNSPIDPLVLNDSLEQKGLLSSLGGFAYLAELSRNIPSATNVIAYTHIIKEYSIKRQLQLLSNELNEKTKSQLTHQELIEFTEQKLFNLSKNNTLQLNHFSMKTELETVLEKLEQRYEAGADAISGAPAGISELDKVTCGFQAGDLVIVAARPSIGKTAFALTTFLNALEKSDTPAFFFSMEMPKEQIIERILASLSNVSLHAIRSGNLSEDDWGKISTALKKILTYENKLIINDESNLNPTQLKSYIRRYIRQYGHPSQITVDYLQLLRLSKPIENRNIEITEISRSLKAIAKEFNIPMIVLAQLNRSVEQRADKRPFNADLRDSGSIEQDADLIIHLYRDEFYNEHTEHKGVMELIIGKNRNGPTGTIKAGFIGKQVRVCELSQMERRYESYEQL